MLLAVVVLWLTLANHALAAGLVGTGTPESCTETALDAALAGGGTVTFNCGAEPVAMTVASEKTIVSETTIDGAGLVTLSGGGAVRIFLVAQGATLNAGNLTITNGKADVGGGIYNLGTLTVSHSTISGNTADAEGGGIANGVCGIDACEGGTLTVTDSVISGNTAGGTDSVASRGGGISSAGPLSVSNSTISANTTETVAGITSLGGGIFSWGPFSVVNSTIAGNTADSGGGIYSGNSESFTVTNTLIAGSGAGGDCVAAELDPPVSHDGGHNLVEDATNACGLTNGVNGNIVGVDPEIGVLAPNGGPTQTMALRPGSPAIDAGDPAVCAAAPVNGLDQRGLARPGAGSTACSIGAYEFYHSSVGTGTPQTCTEAALDAALEPGGLVTFSCGPNPATITIMATKMIEHDTTIDGGGRVTISGGGTVGALWIRRHATFTAQNLIIANGLAESGGGILNRGTATLINSTLTGNAAQYGGAIRNSNTLTLINSTLAGNAADPIGAGLLNDGTAFVTDCTLSGNVASLQGGGIYSHGTTALTSSTLSGNTAEECGGAMFNDGNVPVTNSVTVTNSTLAGNAAGAGGAICNGQNLTLINSTVAGNTGKAVNGAGGILHRLGATGIFTLANSIVAGNMMNTSSAATVLGGDCASFSQMIDGGHNLIQDAANSCGLTNGVNGNIVGVDPRLGPPASNGGPTQTIALPSGSPAIDTGDPEVCANPPVNGVDQRGYVRPGAGHAACSIGAYEYNSPGPPPSCVGDCVNDGQVTVSEILTMVNIALGNAATSDCDAGDENDDGEITIDEILRAVNSALNGCAIPNR